MCLSTEMLFDTTCRFSHSWISEFKPDVAESDGSFRFNWFSEQNRKKLSRKWNFDPSSSYLWTFWPLTAHTGSVWLSVCVCVCVCVCVFLSVHLERLNERVVCQKPHKPFHTHTHTHTHHPIVCEAVGTLLCEANVDMNQDSCERLQGKSPQMVEGEKLQSAVWLLKNRRRRRRRSRSQRWRRGFSFGGDDRESALDSSGGIKNKKSAETFREGRQTWGRPLLAGESDASDKHHLSFTAAGKVRHRQ